MSRLSPHGSAGTLPPPRRRRRNEPVRLPLLPPVQRPGPDLTVGTRSGPRRTPVRHRKHDHQGAGIAEPNGGYTRTWSVWILTLRSSRGVFAAVRPASPHGVAALGILEAWKLACVRVEAGSSRRMCTTWPAGRPRGTRDAPGGGRRHIDASIDKAGRRLPRLARAGKDEQSHEPRPGGLTLRLPEGRRAARPGCPRGRGRAARPRRCAARQGRRAGRTGAPWQRRS